MTIRKKIVSVVLAAVTMAFVVCAVGASFYFYDLLKAHTIQGEQFKITQASRQLNYFQDTIVRIGKQIVVNEEFQRYMQKDTDDDILEQLIAEESVKRICRTFINEQPYIYGVTIVTSDGSSFSSNQTEGSFLPEEEEWYTQFKESGADRGFSYPHAYILEQGSRRRDVVSYVMSFRSLKDSHDMLGDIILHVGISEIENYAQLDSGLLSGYSLYDQWGNGISQAGDMSLSFEEIDNIMDEMVLTLDNGNILLLNRELEYDWMFAGEISSSLLWKQLQFIPLFFVLVFCSISIMLFLVLYFYIRKITGPIGILHDAAVRAGQGDLDIEVHIETKDELAVLGSSFNQMVTDIKSRMEESIAHEKRVREMEISRLMLQINPHFIYNTLNSIVYMARMKGNTDIVVFANAFISLLQDTLKVDSEDLFIPLAQEIKNIRNYLTLQSYRYANRYEVKYEIDDGLENCRVPNVFIQPIVENAIFHGLAGKAEKGILEIKVKRTGESVEILIRDDGVGMTQDKLKQLLEEEFSDRGQMRTIGVGNVKARITYIYGDGYGMTIDSQVQMGTTVKIVIPFHTCE